MVGHTTDNRRVPAGDEHRRDRANIQIQAGLEPALDPAHVRIGAGQVLLAREQQRDVDRHPGEGRLFDRRQPLLGPRDLDEHVLSSGACMQVGRGAHAAGGVVGEQRRDLQRHPAVDPGRPVMYRREQVRCSAEVLDRQLEEQRLALGRCRRLAADLVVVGARLDRLVKDRWVGRQAGDRKLVDVALQLARVEHLSRDVVQPQALTKLL